MEAKPDRPEFEWTAHVKRAYRDDLLGLFTAGEEVQQLVDHPGWLQVQRVIDLALRDEDRMLDGRLLDDRADYAWAHGRRGGLRAMTEAARAIVGHATSELDRQRRIHEATAEPVA